MAGTLPARRGGWKDGAHAARTVVAQPDARLVIGETRPLTRDEADYIAERLRALT